MSNSRNLADLKPAANGVVGTTKGGTGEITRQAAMDALAGAVTSGSYLRGDGTDVVMATIQAGDVPTLNQNTTGTAAGLSATLAVASGGTGQTTLQNAMDALAGAVTSGSYLRGNGTDVVMATIQVADVPTLNQSTTGSAATLTTGRTIAITGDLTYTSGSFNGSANVTGTGTLANSGVTAGTYGSASAIPAITIDAKGRITSATTNAVSGGVTSLNGETGAITNTAANAIGSYVIGGLYNTQVSKGATVAGSSLKNAGNGGSTAQPVSPSFSSSIATSFIGCTGTWRSMMASGDPNTALSDNGYISSLWVRIS